MPQGASWQRDQGDCPPPLNLGLSKNFLLVGKGSSKIQNLGLKISHLGEFKGKIKNLSTHNVLCRKFAAVCRKIAIFCPSYFLTLHAAAPNSYLHFHQSIVTDA